VVIVSAAVLLAAPAAGAAAAPGRLVAHVSVDQARPPTGSTIVATVVVSNVGGSPVDSARTAGPSSTAHRRGSTALLVAAALAALAVLELGVVLRLRRNRRFGRGPSNE